MDWRKRKTVVMGMMERDGDVMLKVAPDQRHGSLIPQIKNNVVKGTELHTDELHTYQKKFNPAEYTHKTVNHSEGEYATPDGTTTNSIENFFGHLKRSLKGTHNNVSPKYLEAVKEFDYRFNRRTTPEVMLGELLSRFPELDA